MLFKCLSLRIHSLLFLVAQSAVTIAVRCLYNIALFLPSDTITPNIRLVGGTNQYEGRVEVYRSNEWQTVCDSYWGIREADVVCRQLGYGYAILTIQETPFGRGSGGIWNRRWFCNGNEARLDDCTGARSFYTHCTHSQDASVICSGNGETRLVHLTRKSLANTACMQL